MSLVARYRINYDECALINYKSINVPTDRPAGRPAAQPLVHPACPSGRPADDETNNEITRAPCVSASRHTNTLLNPPSINHDPGPAAVHLFGGAIARIDVIIADSLFTIVPTTPIFRARDAEFCIAVVPAFSVNYPAYLPVSHPYFFRLPDRH